MFTISRPTHSRDSKASPPQRAPATQAGGAAEGSSSAGAVSSVKPKEAPLAGYLMARASTHQKVEGQNLQNLRAGHESVQQVSDLLPLGGANVIQDIEKAKNRHPDLYLRHAATSEYRLALAQRQMFVPDGVPSKEYFRRIYAASSQHVETGVCESFATNTTPLHAAKMADMKDKRAIVAQATHATIDHTWSEMMPKGKWEDGTPILHGKDVIMDGWCKEKLAVLREDSHFARLDINGKGDHLKHNDLLNHETGPEALKEVAKYKAQLENSPQWKNNYDDYYNRFKGVDTGNEGLWNAQSTFHDDFRKQAGAALHKEAMESPPGKRADTRKFDPVSKQAKHASMAEIQAVGVARSMGANIRGAKADAPEIIASAKEMFPAPPSPVPKKKSFLSRLTACFRP